MALALQDLDSVTQRNAASAEELSSIVQAFHGRAQAMQAAMEYFQLDSSTSSDLLLEDLVTAHGEAANSSQQDPAHAEAS